MNHLWRKGMGNVLPGPEPFYKWVVTVEFYLSWLSYFNPFLFLFNMQYVQRLGNVNCAHKQELTQRNVDGTEFSDYIFMSSRWNLVSTWHRSGRYLAACCGGVFFTVKWNFRCHCLSRGVSTGDMANLWHNAQSVYPQSQEGAVMLQQAG